MPPKKIVSSSPKLDTAEKIKQLSNKKGVTIFIDMDDHTEESKMGSAYSYSSKTKILTIVASILILKDRQLLLDIIKKSFTGGGLILKSSSEGVLEAYQKYSLNNTDKNILEFFQGIIPRDDYNALKVSLYLRYEQKMGKNIYSDKKDIRDRFGERGANIANLCTAGYFENEFYPLFNAAPRELFNEYYELAVGQKARALFIHAGMKKDEIEIAFNEMLEKAVKYHMNDFRIHGLGNQNVSIIKQFFLAKKTAPDDKYIFRKTYEKTDHPLVIEYVITIINKD
jgi:hypothetical protein